MKKFDNIDILEMGLIEKTLFLKTADGRVNIGYFEDGVLTKFMPMTDRVHSILFDLTKDNQEALYYIKQIIFASSKFIELPKNIDGTKIISNNCTCNIVVDGVNRIIPVTYYSLNILDSKGNITLIYAAYISEKYGIISSSASVLSQSDMKILDDMLNNSFGISKKLFNEFKKQATLEIIPYMGKSKNKIYAMSWGRKIEIQDDNNFFLR